MKTETVKVVTEKEFLEHLLARVQQNHETTEAGNRRGGIRKTAKEIGVPEGEVSMVLAGARRPSMKMLDHLNLEKRVVYVRKGGGHA